MAFDCLLFGAGNHGKKTTFSGEVVDKVIAPSRVGSLLGENVAFEIKYHDMGGLTYVYAIYGDKEPTPEELDGFIERESPSPLS